VTRPTRPFPETSYGVVKRLETLERWIGQTAQRLGRPTLSILDYGCGTGDQLTAPLAMAGHDVVGADVHAPSIAQARERYALANLTFELADVDALRASRRTFDVIVCSEVLEHVDDPKTFLAALGSMLRSDGALIVTTPNGYGSFEWLSSLERGLRRWGVHGSLRAGFWGARTAARKLRGLPATSRPLENITETEVGFLNIDSGHVQFFSVGRLESIFSSAGFTVADRRARTFLCGPYVDVLLAMLPGRRRWYAWNNAVADRLPFAAAADWMFLLTPKRP
jgi:2-polyprenyl-3-methyl-5-hydroxy-6-metoxy-1,4-benzoquinol methylase